MQAQLDVNEILTIATSIGEMIKDCELTDRFLLMREQLHRDAAAQRLLTRFAEKKRVFQECERYGHFHPDYHRAFDEVVAVQDELDRLPVMASYRAAERELDELLYDVSKIIAGSVSDTIKVPNNFDLQSGKSGCGDGACSGKCS